MTLDDDLAKLGLSRDQILSINGKPVGEQKPRKIVNQWEPYRSKWEYMYAEELAIMQAKKEIIGWEYESMRLLLAPPRVVEGKTKPGAWYKADFSLWLPGRRLRLVEIKGYQREAAMVRFKAAAAKYKWIEFLMLTRERGEWVRIL